MASSLSLPHSNNNELDECNMNRVHVPNPPDLMGCSAENTQHFM